MEICVVIVTFNRKQLLAESLKSYETQQKKPKEIVVVNNCSTDGTTEFLKCWEDEKSELFIKRVINLDKNIGGAGGFARGMSESCKSSCDFLFLADDDAFAEPDTLRRIEEFYLSYSDKALIGALATSVINGSQYAMGHRRIIKRNFFSITEKSVPNEWYLREYFEIDQLTFVGAAIKCSVVREIGTLKEEYFFQYDDVEYSTRIKNNGYKLICVPASRMRHDAVIGSTVFSWKNYYSARNKLDYAKNNFSVLNYCFYIAVFYLKNCSIIAKITGKRTKPQIRMFKTALRDAKMNKMGLNEIYQPGVDIENLKI